MRFGRIIRPLIRINNAFVKPLGYSVVDDVRLVDYYLHEYSSYDEYKELQVYHNKRKIESVWADKKTLDRVEEIVKKNEEKTEYSGICHGTRNGFEQRYLNSKNSGISAIGTDISDTANEFENTIEWDFHDQRDDWIGRHDFVYSNSLDQSWKPRAALQTWLNQVKNGGVVIIEHTELHGPVGASEMDPFGVRPIAMPYVLADWFGGQISISHSRSKKDNMDVEAWLFVCRKLQDHVD